MRKRHVVCVKNQGYPASLEIGKIYTVLSDPAAATHHQVRVIDESGEDYLYPADFFMAIRLPQDVADALTSAAASA